MIPSALSLSASSFKQANEMKTYELDGGQQVYLGNSMAQRVTMLESQWSLAGTQTFGIFGNICAAVALGRTLAPIGKVYFHMKGQEDKENWKAFSERFTEIATSFEEKFDAFVDKVAPHMQTICAVSAVAMIVFGHIAVGAISLLSVVLAEVKHRNMLPGLLDEILTPVCMILSFYAITISPVFIIFKLLGFIINALDLTNFLLSNPRTKDYMPEFLKKSVPNEHKINKELALESFYGNADAMERVLTSRDALRINLSSFHNKLVSEVVPPEIADELKALKFPEIYKDIEAKIESLGIKLKDEKGWKTLKKSMIDGTCPDTRPANFNSLQDILKAILSELSEEKDAEIFGQKVQELAEIGGQCSEGWLREISFMFNANSKRHDWQAHHAASIFRENLLKQAVQEIAAGLRETAKIEPEIQKMLNVFDLVGGENDIHLINQLQAAMWHRWRTYGGEAFYEIHGKSLVTRLLQRYAETDLNEEPLKKENGTIITWRNFINSFLMQSQVTLPLPMPAFVVAAIMEDRAKKHLTVDNLVDMLHYQAQPQFRQIEENGVPKDVEIRSIPWVDCLQEFLKEMGALEEQIDKKKDSSNSDETFEVLYNQDHHGDDDIATVSGYNSLIVTRQPGRDVNELTREGIKLWLWHNGILEANPDDYFVKTTMQAQGAKTRRQGPYSRTLVQA